MAYAEDCNNMNTIEFHKLRLRRVDKIIRSTHSHLSLY